MGPPDHGGKPKLLAWLAEFLQVVELEDRFDQADSSSGGERAPFLQALGQSLLKRVGIVLKRLEPCTSASIKKIKLCMKIHPSHENGGEQRQGNGQPHRRFYVQDVQDVQYGSARIVV